MLTELWPREPQWPAPIVRTTQASLTARLHPRTPMPASNTAQEDELVTHQPFCVASSVRSSGSLGDSVLYRYRRDGDTLYVGYFVYFSTERPWGDNALTHKVLPALAIDAFYSHFMFVLPGAQRLLYGPADIEGALVRYRIEGDRLVAQGALADDEEHHRVRLDAEELRAPNGNTLLLTETWSHQLGAHDAVRRSASLAVRCFSGSGLVPLSTSVADAFRLGSESAPHRAKPAWRASLD
jgi:hypothetical protein